MDPERWRQIDQLFAAALELPVARRSAFLDGACGADGVLRRKVEALLASDERSAVFIDRPVASLPPDEPPESVVHFGPYRSIRTLSRGWMATVYLAEHEELAGQLVAVKVLRSYDHLRAASDSDLRLRFEQEQRILAQMRHPNVALLFDIGVTSDDRPYLVMEYVEGSAIDVFCRRRGLDLRQKIELFRNVCDAVQHAHQHLLVHRDLKPSNILVSEHGIPKLLDFGIAKSLHPERFAAAVTGPGIRPMTRRYASPEQIRGRPIDIQSDVYSLGVVLYELLTGTSPFGEVESDFELEKAICERPVEAPSRRAERLLARRLRGDLDRILGRALAKEPEHRYPTVERFSDDLRRHLQDLPISVRPQSFIYEIQKFVRRHRLQVAATVGFTILVSAFFVMFVFQRARLAEQRELARVEAENAKHQRHKAELTLDFMEDLLRLANPTQTAGRTFSPRQLLDAVARHARQALGDQPEVLAALLTAVSEHYGDLGQHGITANLLEDAVALRREHLPAGDPLLAESLTQLASLHIFRGRYDEAESLIEQALEIWRRPGLDRPVDLMMALVQLASAQRLQGHPAGAERACREAVELAGDHPAAAQALGQLGLALRDLGRFAEAEQSLEQSMEMMTLAMGEEHPLVAQARLRLASVMNAAGQPERARPLIDESLELFETMLGGDHPLRLEARWQLGRALDLAGNRDEAILHYRFVFEHREQKLGTAHPSVQRQRQMLLEALEAAGLSDEAEQLRRAPTVMTEAEDSRLQIVDPVVKRTDLAEEVVKLARALEEMEASRDESDWQVHEGRFRLGELLARMGRFEEAEPLLLKGYRGLDATLGADARVTRHSLDAVIALYTDWRRSERAEAFRRLKQDTPSP